MTNVLARLSRARTGDRKRLMASGLMVSAGRWAMEGPRVTDGPATGADYFCHPRSRQDFPVSHAAASGYHCPEKMLTEEIEWLPVGRTQFIAWLVFYGLILFYLAAHFSQPTLLDNIHLVVHEGGHLLFGWFGQTLGLWGGTLLQLLVPALLAVTFAVRSEIPGVAFCSFAFFHSLTGVATYMIDALRLELPLVTVGAPADEAEHDWVRIFTQLGLLPHAIQIGNTVRFIAWLGMLGSIAWFSWQFYRQQNESD